MLRPWLPRRCLLLALLLLQVLLGSQGSQPDKQYDLILSNLTVWGPAARRFIASESTAAQFAGGCFVEMHVPEKGVDKVTSCLKSSNWVADVAPSQASRLRAPLFIVVVLAMPLTGLLW